MHHAPLITTFVAAFVLAFALGMVAVRLKVSPIVGYLLAGLVVGPYTPGYVADTDLSQALAELGVILLMFGVGLHFSLDRLMEVRGISLPGAIVQIAVATALGAGLGWSMGWPLAAGLVFGLCLSVASTVVLLRALDEQNLIETKRGQIAVGWLIVEDLFMILALVLLPALTGLLGEPVNTLALQLGGGNIAETIFLTIGKVGLFIAVMLLAGPRVIPRVLDRVARTGSRELFTLAVLALAMGIAYAAAELASASFALGAFFAGMVLAGSKLSQNAAERSLPLRDAFAVLFFVSVGMLFDPMTLVNDPIPVLVTVAIILFGKSVAAFAIVRMFGYTPATAATIAVSLAQIGEFSFILAALAMKLGVLPKEGHDLVVAGAILSIMLNPLMFYLLRRYERWLNDYPAETIEEDEPLATPVAFDMRDHVIVVGYGRVGKRIVEQLNGGDSRVLLVEANRDRIDANDDQRHRAIFGQADKRETLIAAGIRQARALMIAVPRAFDAARIVETARALAPGIEIIVRAEFDAEAEHLRASGANTALIAEQVLADRMVAILQQPQPQTA